jgi:hypothetical protein
LNYSDSSFFSIFKIFASAFPFHYTVFRLAMAFPNISSAKLIKNPLSHYTNVYVVLENLNGLGVLALRKEEKEGV